MSPQNGKASRVLVAMSGGVDSSLAAAILLERGFEVVGATIKTFCYGDVAGSSKSCCGLGVVARPVYIINFDTTEKHISFLSF